MSDTFGHSTPRPYFEDPYTVAFQATVDSLRSDARGDWVTLRESYFYPTGGGQECDLGTLGPAAVVDVEEDDGGASLVLEGAGDGGVEAAAGGIGVVDALRHTCGTAAAGRST
jgi:Ser-tRNA(Ala) deacylase AlaX